MLRLELMRRPSPRERKMNLLVLAALAGGALPLACSGSVEHSSPGAGGASGTAGNAMSVSGFGANNYGSWDGGYYHVDGTGYPDGTHYQGDGAYYGDGVAYDGEGYPDGESYGGSGAGAPGVIVAGAGGEGGASL